MGYTKTRFLEVPYVLASNFSKPAELFEQFPHQDVFIADQDRS